MTAVCFTGAGKVNGKAVTRAEWETLARGVGYYTTDNATNANVLVASRTDTVKAINAAARGIKVLSYETFHIECLERGSVSDRLGKGQRTLEQGDQVSRYQVGDRVTMELKMTGETLRGVVVALDHRGMANVQFDDMADETWQWIDRLPGGLLSPNEIEDMRSDPAFGMF